jgi:uncharacterized protein YndB with AHSA1/START domain
MTAISTQSAVQDIVIDDVFPHAPATVWKALTDGELIARWLMTPQGFEPVKGNHFTFQTPPSDEWDGVIRCEVLEVETNKRFVYAWRTGNDRPEGYVGRLDTVVSWTLSPVDQGTRVRLVHSGFDTEKYGQVFNNISEGWPKVIAKMLDLLAEDGQ